MNHTAARHTRFHGRVVTPEPLTCAAPGCTATAEFRAPASNRAPGDVGGWQWLCLDHVRAFNSGYNFFDGLGPDEIYEAQSPMAAWASVADPHGPRFNDPHGVLGARVEAARAKAAGPALTDRDRRALKVLGLPPAALIADIRAAYRKLVRRFHPDANGGDRAHEARLQEVVQAYTHLKSAAAFRRPA